MSSNLRTSHSHVCFRTTRGQSQSPAWCDADKLGCEARLSGSAQRAITEGLRVAIKVLLPLGIGADAVPCSLLHAARHPRGFVRPFVFLNSAAVWVRVSVCSLETNLGLRVHSLINPVCPGLCGASIPWSVRRLSVLPPDKDERKNINGGKCFRGSCMNNN